MNATSPEMIARTKAQLEREECGPDEEMVVVDYEYFDQPHTRHMSWAARRILNQIPVFEKRKKRSVTPAQK